MKGKSDCSLRWKPGKRPEPLYNSFSCSQETETIRSSPTWKRTAAQQRAGHAFYQQSTFTQREVSVNMFGWWRHRRKRICDAGHASPHLSLTQAPPVQQRWWFSSHGWQCSGWRRVRWADSGCSQGEEKWACTCVPQGADYNVWGAERPRTPAPVIERPVASLWASLDRDNVRITLSRGPIHQYRRLLTQINKVLFRFLCEWWLICHLK